MQTRHLFCMLVTASLLLNSGVAHGGALITALTSQSDPRDPASYRQQFSIFIAAISNKNRQALLPKPQQVFLPVTVGAFMAKDWYFTTFKGNPCHIPEGSLLSVSALSKNRLVAALQWPFNYRLEGRQCADRQPPSNGRCFNGSEPKVQLCSNGAEIMLDWSDALDEEGKPLNPEAVTEVLRAALSASAE